MNYKNKSIFLYFEKKTENIELFDVFADGFWQIIQKYQGKNGNLIRISISHVVDSNKTHYMEIIGILYVDLSIRAQFVHAMNKIVDIIYEDDFDKIATKIMNKKPSISFLDIPFGGRKYKDHIMNLVHVIKKILKIKN